MADFCPPGKNVWPELVGIKATIAKHIIKKDNSNVERVETILAGSGVTKDLRCDRVRMFVNIEEIIVETPRIG
ncbi:unnamed protein product [Citrullus colocynthis]|uniref:Uncharacterized protein n=1 Tax=Citrullus colocynthis TaxID=252529 RepID=A0ABP0YV95_9ROSI